MNVDLRVDYRLMSTLNFQSTYTQAKATKSFSCLHAKNSSTISITYAADFEHEMDPFDGNGMELV